MKIVLSKLTVLMIVVLLSYLKGWSLNDNDSITLQGKSDSLTFALISISDIKAANIKMLERKMLIDIVNQKDTIISFKDSYIKEQEKIIGDYSMRLNAYNEINNNLNKTIKKQKTIIIFTSGVAATAILTSIVLIISK